VNDYDRSCSVVDSISCEAAPGQGAEARSLVTCWGCGDDVCRACSAIVPYRWKGQRRRVRLCLNCQEQRRVGRYAPEAIVERRRLRDAVAAL
jgi:hypothetical protein